jgi:hypothetical protein
MAAINSKQRLLEMMSKLDGNFDSSLNENEKLVDDKFMENRRTEKSKVLNESKLFEMNDKLSRKTKRKLNEGEAWASDGGYYNKHEYDQTGDDEEDEDPTFGNDPRSNPDKGLNYKLPDREADNTDHMDEDLSGNFAADADYSRGEYFEDKLGEILGQMVQSDYSYDEIISLVEKILQKQN